VTFTWTNPYRVSSAAPVAVPDADEVDDVPVVDVPVVDDEEVDDDDVDGAVVEVIALDDVGDAVRDCVRKLKTATTPTAVAVRT
jgi:hypothetical protein